MDPWKSKGMKRTHRRADAWSLHGLMAGLTPAVGGLKLWRTQRLLPMPYRWHLAPSRAGLHAPEHCMPFMCVDAGDLCSMLPPLAPSLARPIAKPLSNGLMGLCEYFSPLPHPTPPWILWCPPLTPHPLLAAPPPPHPQPQGPPLPAHLPLPQL